MVEREDRLPSAEEGTASHTMLEISLREVTVFITMMILRARGEDELARLTGILGTVTNGK
jgi:hypothetical protein